MMVVVDEETPLLFGQQQQQPAAVVTNGNHNHHQNGSDNEQLRGIDEEPSIDVEIIHTQLKNHMTTTSTYQYYDHEYDSDELLATPVIDMRKSQHEKTVSLLLVDETDHIFRIVEPGDDNILLSQGGGGGREDDGSCNALLPLPSIVQRERSESFMSEIIADVKETIAEVKDEIIEVLHEDIITPIKPRDYGDHSQKLSAIALAVMVFYKVSGGPFGCEPTVKAAGPFFALLGFLIVPIFVSIPEALVTAELGSAYPEPSGGTFFFFVFVYSVLDVRCLLSR
jgi:hypothetical protein